MKRANNNRRKRRPAVADDTCALAVALVEQAYDRALAFSAAARRRWLRIVTNRRSSAVGAAPISMLRRLPFPSRANAAELYLRGSFAIPC